ncbi:hypothetical protein SCLCIDRAFT_1209906 [Scleroderma citrinum Foug A]|uniref:Uncharacterized protein n=1 Tax=Scleroderma citrinum Foug A TaxID=1036808 RepID=A0A0C3E4P6_9AGAM|nr:hypothetical protein SCLCIDRAFT_1209906 [Scleroderma citrinum Foug A]
MAWRVALHLLQQAPRCSDETDPFITAGWENSSTRSTTCVINFAWNFWFDLSKEATHLKDGRRTQPMLLMFYVRPPRGRAGPTKGPGYM